MSQDSEYIAAISMTWYFAIKLSLVEDALAASMRREVKLLQKLRGLRLEGK